VREKGKQSNLERYGVEHQMLSKEIKDKIKKNNIEKYGFEYPMQNPEIAFDISIKYSKRKK
jgi:hypothetical protein